ncbi:glutamine synthetase family protein [Candidatus Manganitrophus noduliformans]|uniref:Glutamine synthetase n=1 Tax=Candidatus Manganitrophus noduliformans TaxID=2606439 RepID=A0A7X6DSC8_9BACT|nr:glutamine synthetase family protein [Candidatus Manganitrophus noduliformans]NKE72500.1 glutamine synthetase [Candidatus Manganitrophus noduliformans]
MSSKIPGMLTQDELARRVSAGEIDTVLLVFTDHYGRFMGKRLDADFFLEDAAKKGTHACDYLLTVDMEMEPVPGYRFANWEKGYGDFHLIPDFATLRVASWLEKTALLICDVENEKNHRPVVQAPRSILRKQIDRAAKMGYRAIAASELEYYIYKNSYRDAAAKGYSGLEPAGWYLEDYHALQGAREEGFNGAARRHLKRSGIPVETSKGEWGLGQHELNVRYADILTMADRHVTFKQCLKEIAEQMGLSVTFMAKIAADQAGSSCHIHLSLWQKNHPAFPGKQRLGPVACSETFRWFLGGWIAHVPEMMVFYAPTINSYKRYQAGSWAPTRMAWSYDNRTAGFRVVGEGNSLRIECRIPGADCNPYLAFAAALASGLDGIENRIEPPPIFEGDVYAAQNLPRVPRTLREATDLFEKSEFAKSALGEEVVEHYLHFYRTEQEAYDKAVTDWERQRYFERI